MFEIHIQKYIPRSEQDEVDKWFIKRTANLITPVIATNDILLDIDLKALLRAEQMTGNRIMYMHEGVWSQLDGIDIVRSDGEVLIILALHNDLLTKKFTRQLTYERGNLFNNFKIETKRRTIELEKFAMIVTER